MVPDCLKLPPDSFSGGQKALYVRVASDLVKWCLVLSGVFVSCLIFNGRLSSCFFSYVVRPGLVLSCVLLHIKPFPLHFFHHDSSISYNTLHGSHNAHAARHQLPRYRKQNSPYRQVTRLPCFS